MEKIKIGKIVNAVALRGEVKVYSYSDRKERYEELKEILVEEKKGTAKSQPLTLVGIAFINGSGK